MKNHRCQLPRKLCTTSLMWLAFTASTVSGFFDGTDNETDSLMRDAHAQIEQVRKGDFSLNFVDQHGNPVHASKCPSMGCALPGPKGTLTPE